MNNEYSGIIEKFLTELNLKDQTPNNYWDDVKSWLSWYKGKVEDFHSYYIYNGKDKIPSERKSLQMAKMCCEDWADLLMNEKVKIMIDDDSLMERLEFNLMNNNFFVQSNQLIEKTFALGEGAFIEYITGNPNKPVEINYCNATMIFPLRVINGEILDCAFCWKLKDDTFFATVHLENKNGGYTIINKMFNEKDGKVNFLNLSNVKEKQTSKVKLFQIIKPNMANNLNIDSSRGLSVFANSIDNLKDVDLKFDSYFQEFNLGRKRALFNSSIARFNTDDRGNLTPLFDSTDLAFYQLEMGETNKPLEFIDTNLRVEEHDRAVQTSLNLFSNAVGLGNNHYVFRDGKVYQNQDQIISSNSKMFRRLKKHESVIEKALIDLTKAVLYLDTGKIIDKDISINFDDSIIENKAEEQRQALLEFNAGLIDEVQYFMETRGMDESTAQTFVDTIKSRKPIEEEPPIEGDE